MIIRSRKLPDMEFEVFTDFEVSLAHRAILEMTRGAGTSSSTPSGTSSAPLTGGETAEPAPGTECTPASATEIPNLKNVLSILAQILWSYDIAALRTVRLGRTRRKVIEEQLAGHSFNKFEPRLKKAAEAAEIKMEDLLVIEKLSEGLARETWFAAGPVLMAISVEMLEQLEAQLKSKEAKRSSKA